MENQRIEKELGFKIFPEILESDSGRERFFKEHNIIACPECGGELDFIGYEEVGEKGKIITGESSGDPYRGINVNYTHYYGNADGARHNGRLDCKRCGFAFLKQSYTEYKYKSRLEDSFRITLIGYAPISECSERTSKIFDESCEDSFYEELQKP